MASHGTNVLGMKFLHQIVFQLLGKITEWWNIGHTDLDIFYVNQLHGSKI